MKARLCSQCNLPGHDRRSHGRPKVSKGASQEIRRKHADYAKSLLRRKNPPAFKGAKKDDRRKLTAKEKAKQFDQRWLFDDPRGIGGFEQHKLFDDRKKNPRRRR